MYRIVFLMAGILFSTHVNAEWWGMFSDEKNLMTVYEDNESEVQNMSIGIYEVDNIFFSKVVSPDTNIKTSRSWGKLKLRAQKQLSNFVFQKRLEKLSFQKQALYKSYPGKKTAIKIQEGMVVKKMIENGEATLIFGVPSKDVLFKLPPLN